MDFGLIRDILSWILFLVGGGCVVTGAIGVVRFPDFYARMHAAGMTDTGGAMLILFGMMLQSEHWILVAKLGFIVVFLALTSPLATHAVAHAAWMVGFRPLEGPELRIRGEDDDE